MRKLAALVSVAINLSTLPALASECAPPKDLNASRARWAAVRKRPMIAADNQAACRAYAASFYESVTTRQAAAICNHDVDRQRELAVLDSEIHAFNNLLAVRCAD